MFIKANSCPVCFSPWEKDSDRCVSCGSVVELYFEHSLADKNVVNEEKLEQNISRLRTFLVDHENHGLAHYTLGLIYVNLGLISEGLAEIRRAAQLMPEKVQIAYETIVLAAKQGDFSDEILNQISRVIKRKPNFKEALYLQGVILGKRKQFVDAVRVLQNTYQLDSNYTPPKQWLRWFIRQNEDLFQDPNITRHISTKPLPKNAINYLNLTTSDEPAKPPPLGETSMKVLEVISQEKADLMRKMYAEDHHRYEELKQQRKMQFSILREDVIALSELSIAAYETKIHLAASRTTNSQQPLVNNAGSLLTITERSHILELEVTQYQKQGFTLIARTETTAQLSKKNEFDFCLAFFLVLIVIGIFLYLLYYLTAKKEHLVFLEVDEFGRIHKTHS